MSRRRRVVSLPRAASWLQHQSPNFTTVADVTSGRAMSWAHRSGDGALVRLAGGGTLEVAGVFVATTLHQAAPFAEQLGLTANDSGCVRVDERCRTSRPGVYAAGDMAHVEALPMPMTSVAQAIASGSLAGATAAAELIADEQAAVARGG